MPTSGDPKTRFNLKDAPVLYGIAWSFISIVSLGLSKSMNSVPTLLTSYPFTYALPEDTWYKPRSSFASPPSSVSPPSSKTPLFPNLLFADSLTFIWNGLTI